MAIAIPLVMGAMGASGTMIALTSVAFAVTGISSKIDQAAAGVFGADLVKIGDIFGAAYGMASGAFSGAGGVTDPSSVNAVNGMDAASDAFTASGATGAGGFSPELALENTAVPGATEAATDFANQSEAVGQMGGDVADFNSGNVMDRIGDTGNVGNTGAVQDVRELANQTQQPVNLLQGPDSANVGAAGTQATSAQASGQVAQTAAGQGAAAPTASGAQASAPQVNAGATTPTAPTQPRSFFDKLLYDSKGNLQPATIRMGGQLLNGIGQGYTESQKMQQRRDEFNRQMQMFNQRPGVRVTQ